MLKGYVLEMSFKFSLWKWYDFWVLGFKELDDNFGIRIMISGESGLRWVVEYLIYGFLNFIWF